MNDIWLKNGQKAIYRTSLEAMVPDLNMNEKTTIHLYGTPCPICHELNSAHSTDGIFFITAQINCKSCGIFYRPIVDFQWASEQMNVQ